MFKNALNWEFMNEPVYRWFVFLGIMILISAMWGMILGYFKAVVD